MSNFIDTNILIYCSFSEIEDKHNKAMSYLKDNNNFIISNQIIFEYIRVSTNKKIFENPLSTNVAFNNLDRFLRFIDIVKDHNINYNNLKDIALKQESIKNIFDLNIYLTMKLNNISNLITFNDKDFKNFKDINIIIP